MITRTIQLRGKRQMRTMFPAVLLGLALIALPASAQSPLGGLLEKAKRAAEERVVKEVDKLTKSTPDKPEASPEKASSPEKTEDQKKSETPTDAPKGSVKQFVSADDFPKDGREYKIKLRSLAKACKEGGAKCFNSCSLAASHSPGYGPGSESERECVDGYNAMMSGAGGSSKDKSSPATSPAKASSTSSTSQIASKPSQLASSSKDPVVQHCYGDRLMSKLYDCGCVEGVIPSIRAELAETRRAHNIAYVPRAELYLKSAKEGRSKATTPQQIKRADERIAELERQIRAAPEKVDPASIGKEEVLLEFGSSGKAMCRVSEGIYQDELASCLEGASSMGGLMDGKDPKKVCACSAKRVATDWSAAKLSVYTQESIIYARTQARYACSR
ncbi:MAG: hypothetical protein ACOYM8_13980 [Caulobacterales bacterium]